MNYVDLLKSFKSFFDILKTLPASEGFGYSVRYLTRGTPLVLRLATLLALLFSIILGAVTYLNLSEANTSFVSSLTSPWDRSDLPHSGLEAFLVATLLTEDDWHGLDSIQNARVRPSFKEAVERLKLDLSSPSRSDELDIDVIRIPMQHTDPGAGVFLSDRSEGFLFVPGIQLTNFNAVSAKIASVSLEKSMTDTYEKETIGREKLRVSDDPAVLNDVALSEVAAAALCGNREPQLASLRDLNSGSENSVFESAQGVLSEHFSQAYIVFQSGVSRLCEFAEPPDYKTQRGFYGVRFKPFTLLQERPYFQGTVSKAFSTSDSSVEEYFFESGPYMDIAGNGIVDTFCRYISVIPPVGESAQTSHYRTDAVVCIDFNIKKNLTTALIPRVARYGGTAALVSCEGARCTKSGEPEVSGWFTRESLLSLFFGGKPVNEEDVNFIENKYHDAQRASSTSQILGRVGTFPLDKSKVLFTIPTGHGKLLVGKLDLAAYQTRSFILLLLAGIAISATVVLLFFGVADYGLKIKEQQRAFEAVDQVMTDLKLPYMRVDESGKINHLNDEAARELGYSSANEALPQLKSRTFEELLADNTSDDEYLRVKQERLDGLPYRHYSVRLWTSKSRENGPSKEFEVHGWNVPTPQVGDKRPGQSFGILIPEDSALRNPDSTAASGSI